MKENYLENRGKALGLFNLGEMASPHTPIPIQRRRPISATLSAIVGTAMARARGRASASIACKTRRGRREKLGFGLRRTTPTQNEAEAIVESHGLFRGTAKGSQLRRHGHGLPYAP